MDAVDGGGLVVGFSGCKSRTGSTRKSSTSFVPGSTWRRYCDTSLYHRAGSCFCRVPLSDPRTSTTPADVDIDTSSGNGGENDSAAHCAQPAAPGLACPDAGIHAQRYHGPSSAGVQSDGVGAGPGRERRGEKEEESKKRGGSEPEERGVSAATSARERTTLSYVLVCSLDARCARPARRADRSATRAGALARRCCAYRGRRAFRRTLASPCAPQRQAAAMSR